MKWGISIATIVLVFLISIFLSGCRDTPIGYSIYNKVVMEEPSKLSFAYDAGTYKYTYMNGSSIKIVLANIEIPSNNTCEQKWKMKGITFVQENIVGRVVNIQFVKENNVYVSLDGVDVGLTLLKEGYAKAKDGNYSMHDEYIAGQDYAKKNKNGIWSCG